MKEKIASFDEDNARTDKFIAVVRRYTDFTELTTPMLNEFIKKVAGQTGIINTNMYYGGVTMADKFVVRSKSTEKKEDKSVVMTLRLDKELQEAFDKLAVKSDRSRNELMCMALRYALEHLEFIPNSE